MAVEEFSLFHTLMFYFCISICGWHLMQIQLYCSPGRSEYSQALLELFLLAMLSRCGGELLAARHWLVLLLLSLFLMTQSTVHLLICQLIWHLFYKGGMKQQLTDICFGLKEERVSIWLYELRQVFRRLPQILFQNQICIFFLVLTFFIKKRISMALKERFKKQQLITPHMTSKSVALVELKLASRSWVITK